MLFLSRLAHAKGVDDLIAGFATSSASADLTLVIAGDGPQAEYLHEVAAASPAAARIRFLNDVDDDEKPHLMAGCAAFVLPSKPRPEFIETFGIALVEKMLAGGGPVITTDTGGIGEAVGDTALIVPVDSPSSITAALDLAVTMPLPERADMAARARAHALQFDRTHVFDQLLERVDEVVTPEPGGLAGRSSATGSAVSTPAPTGSAARPDRGGPAGQCCCESTHCRSRSCPWSPSS